jgi:uncharacterized protein (TIGR03437 family)
MRRVLAIALAMPLVWAPALAQTTWQLVWSDEFNGPANSPPDPTKWTYDLGATGWGNDELEDYTNLIANAYLDGQGHLDIHVESTSTGYTSARLKTQGLFTVKYGRIEARIKLPFGQGIWPAFWMLGSDITSVGWPACGEIDIMENIGSTPSTNYGSVHAPNYNVTALYTLLNGQQLSSDFHRYAIQWSPEAITFYVDGTSYQTIAQSTAGASWVFNTPFFLILNVAVGGDFPGSPNATTQFPQDMLVDYVRVYQTTTAAGPVLNTGGVVDAASSGAALAPGSLASAYGPSLAATTDSATFTAGAFPTSISELSVFVNGLAAPLTFLSPIQINFAIPWDSLIGTPLDVEVMLNNVLSNAVPITLTSAAPSAFTTNGVAAILTCQGGAPQAGAACTLWGNGFGPTNPPLVDGTPSPLAYTTTPCTLTIGGVSATVTYCGTAPGLIIYQMNFVYPSGIQASGTTAQATIAINGNTGKIIVPAPQ